jgi:putative uncharacterized protein MYPE4820
MMKPFDKIEPVFNIDDKMNNLLRTIELKLNQISITDKQKRKYMISKSRVRSIHSSLSIEANSLPLYAVENIVQEMFVLNNFKRKGIGSKAVIELFDNHKGNWKIKSLPLSKQAESFWVNIVKEHTNNNLEVDYIGKYNRAIISFNNE